MCGGNCGGGLLDGMGPGRRIGAGIGGGAGVVGGALGGLHGPTPGNPRMAGDFNWQGRHQARHAPPVAEPGPQTAAYTYPYYTTRGPRDFFMNNPPSIGR